MKNCSPNVAPIFKGDRFDLNQCPKNDFEWEHMKSISYALVVGSLIYAQVCTKLNITFSIEVLRRYQSNSGIDHWKAVKKVMRYLQRTKDYMLMYIRTDSLEVIGYFDVDFAGCVDSRKSTSSFIFKHANGVVSWRGCKTDLGCHFHYGS